MNKNDSNIMTQRIKSEARQLSAKYKLDQKRVVNVLHKIAEINWYDSSNATYSELEKAFDYLSPDDALVLFEKEDLTRLATRVMLVEYLNDNTIPFYTLDKLADLTKEFIDHLHENKDHLIKTGFPETTFEKSPWLDKHLNKLYYVKMPVSVHEIVLPSIGRRKGKLENIYSWNEATVDYNNAILFKIQKTIKELKQYQYRDRKDKESQMNYDALSVHLHDMLRQLELNLSSYDEAPLIQGLTEEDAIKIEGIRDKLFNLKISVLDKLYDSAKSKNKNKLITDCVKIINKYLTAEEIDFLIKQDHFYNNLVNVINGENSYYLNIDNSLINHNAGLSDLFMVIGHFYKEIELFTMDEISKASNDLPERSLPASYYEAVGKRWQKDLDALLYYFAVLEERESKFWNEYKLRINKMLNQGKRFSQKNDTPVRNKKSMDNIESLEVNVSDTKEVTIDRDTFEAVLKEFFKTGGEVTFKFPPSKNLSTQKPEYVFVNMGKVWRIVYEGNEIFINDMIGLQYIKILLSDQFEDYNPAKLVSIVQKNLPNNTPYSNMGHDELAKENLYVSAQGSDTDVVDLKAKQEILNRMKELDELIEEALSNNQDDLANEYDKELGELENIAFKEYSESLKRSSKNKDYKRTYDLVYANITRAIDEINKLNHEIGNHFKYSIHTGKETSYCPPDRIPWILEAKLLN